MAEVARVRVELQEQNGRLQAELAAQEALKEKVAALERQLRGGPARPAVPQSRSRGSQVGAAPGGGLGEPRAASLGPSQRLTPRH